MRKKFSLKFWIAFWIISGLFLISWFLFWQIENRNIGPVADRIPVSERWKTLAHLSDYALAGGGKEKTFLILFQNNMEIRPGGGFIGSFATIKINDGKIGELKIYDLSNFDRNVPDGEIPPYPMEETLGIKSWKLRDSNFSPDFKVNAEKAEYFYHLGKGEEKLDGVIGITANVLTSFLKATGPVQLEGYPGTYADENAILALEYQVEKAYFEQGIEKDERKSVMNDLAREIIKKVSDLSILRKMELGKIILNDLEKKDIQLYLKDEGLEKKINAANWGGRVDSGWKSDYLLVSDANLGAFKSDYYVKRSMEYSIDFSQDVPSANLKITYAHTAEQKDWMTRDYIDYLRVYVPEGSKITGSKNTAEVRSGNELGKTFFGSLVKVPIGEEKTIEFTYALPDNFKGEPYALKIQKQAGINGTPAKIQIIDKNGKKEYNIKLESDMLLGQID